MTKPLYKEIDLCHSQFGRTDATKWGKEHALEANWTTPEQIKVKPVYTADDIEELEHLDYVSGLPPLPPWSV